MGTFFRAASFLSVSFLLLLEVKIAITTAMIGLNIVAHCTMQFILLTQFFNDFNYLLVQLVTFCNKLFEFSIDLFDVDNLASIFLLNIA